MNTTAHTTSTDAAGRSLQRLKRLRLACWLWLARPGVGRRLSFHPRAHEIRVRYREQTGDRPGPVRTATLQDLLQPGLPDFDLIRPHGSTNREHFLRTLSREVTAAGLLFKRIQEAEPPITEQTIESVLTSLLAEHPHINAALVHRESRIRRSWPDWWRGKARKSSRLLNTPSHLRCRRLAATLRAARKQLSRYLAAAAEAQRETRRPASSSTCSLTACTLVIWNEAARPGLRSRRMTPLDELLERVAADAGSSRSIISVVLPEIGLAAYIQAAAALGVRLDDLINRMTAYIALRDESCLLITESFWGACTQDVRVARLFVRKLGFPWAVKGDPEDDPEDEPSRSPFPGEDADSAYGATARARGPPAHVRSGAVKPAPAAPAAR